MCVSNVRDHRELHRFLIQRLGRSGTSHASAMLPARVVRNLSYLSNRAMRKLPLNRLSELLHILRISALALHRRPLSGRRSRYVISMTFELGALQRFRLNQHALSFIVLPRPAEA